jgi:protein-disulfide isomerase
MNTKIKGLVIISFIVLGFGITACSDDVVSAPKFIFSSAPNQEAAFKFDGKVYTTKELVKGHENDIYELENKLFELKMNRVKGLILKRLIDSDSRKGSLTEEQFVEKHIVNNVKVTDTEIKAFIKDRKIPEQHINDQLKDRIQKFIIQGKTQELVDSWLDKKIAKSPAEVYFSEPQQPVFNVSVGDAPVLGNKNAKVTLVEYSDFQCPYCAKGSKIMHELKKKYGDKVQVAFKNFPLPFHKQAKGAALAGLCANEQGKNYFWKLHDYMFDNQSKLDSKNLKKVAAAFQGFDPAKFGDCVDKNKYMANIDSDIKEGKVLGVKSTPTFFLNGKIISGALPVEEFSKMIDKELK